MVDVTISPFMLSVVMLIVVMLIVVMPSVVAPTPEKKSTERAEKFVEPFAIAILTINQRLFPEKWNLFGVEGGRYEAPRHSG
jgi:hypothetical protein